MLIKRQSTFKCRGMQLVEVMTQTDKKSLGIRKMLDLRHEVTEMCVRVWSHKMGIEAGMTKSGSTLGL